MSYEAPALGPGGSPAAASPSSDDRRYLQLLAKSFPDRQSVYTEIINLEAICNLPAPTEHFMSDVHGEYEAFAHILNNCSGAIRERVAELFAGELDAGSQADLCTLIYYPREKLGLLHGECAIDAPWYRATLMRLVRLARCLSDYYTRSKVRKAMPVEYAYIIDELLHTSSGDGVRRQEYHEQIIESIIETGAADDFIESLAALIKRLAVDRLHLVGDIFDRGPHPDRILDRLMEYHSLDSRHLYTQGSNNFQFFPNIQENDDFFSGVRLSRERLIRGSYAMCVAPLGFIQTDEPNTAHSYDGLIFPEADESSEDGGAVEIEIQYGTGVKRVKAVGSSGLVPTKPLVTHEVGQYFVYPDYNEIEKYTGVLKPYSLEVFRERLKKAGMLSYADRFHRASGMLAFQCYKLEIEAAMRSEYLSGFQLLDLQDFSGQGVALVGMLNAFMEEKSFVQENGLREKWLGFCSDVVILAEIQSFVLTAGRSVEIPVKIRNMSAESLCGRTLKWRFGSQSGELAIPESASELFTAGTITILPDASGRQCLALCIDGVTENSYDMWVFDAPDGDFSIAESLEINGRTVFITSDITRAESLLHDGERVLCLPNELRESIKGFYCADFWNFPMFRAISESMGREVPVGTLGLVIDCTHPALSGFPTEEYSTPQWYHIVSHADCAVLDGTPEEYRPIVQMADNVERNHKLALLYEAEVGEGRLLVCTARLSEISDRAEVQTLFRGLTEYIASDAFKPEFSADLGALCLR